MAETATAPTETLKISDPSSVQHVKRRNFVFPGCLAARRGKDGTTMQIARLPDIDDNTWAEVKAYVEGPPRNPSVARSRRAHSSMAFGRPSVTRQLLCLLTQAIRRLQRPCRTLPKTRKPCEARTCRFDTATTCYSSF